MRGPAVVVNKSFRFADSACIAAFLGAALVGGAAAAVEPGVPRPSDHTLRLAEFAFDPLSQQPTLPQGWDRSVQGAPDLHLIQFDGPIPGDAFDRLRAGGVEPVQYVFPDTYIVWGQSTDRDRLRGQRRVRWTGDFAPAFRVQPQWRDRRGELIDMRVLIYRGAHVDTVVAALSKIGSAIGSPSVINDKFAIAGLRLPGELMRFAAAIPGVYSIQPIGGEWSARAEVSDQININDLDEFNLAVPGYQN